MDVSTADIPTTSTPSVNILMPKGMPQGTTHGQVNHLYSDFFNRKQAEQFERCRVTAPRQSDAALTDFPPSVSDPPTPHAPGRENRRSPLTTLNCSGMEPDKKATAPKIRPHANVRQPHSQCMHLFMGIPSSFPNLCFPIIAIFPGISTCCIPLLLFHHQKKVFTQYFFSSFTFWLLWEKSRKLQIFNLQTYVCVLYFVYSAWKERDSFEDCGNWKP